MVAIFQKCSVVSSANFLAMSRPQTIVLHFHLLTYSFHRQKSHVRKSLKPETKGQSNSIDDISLVNCKPEYAALVAIGSSMKMKLADVF